MGVALRIFGRSTPQVSVFSDRKSLTFWPDATGEQGGQKVYTHIWRLRRNFYVQEVLLIENERYVLHDALLVAYDVRCFEYLIEKHSWQNTAGADIVVRCNVPGAGFAGAARCAPNLSYSCIKVAVCTSSGEYHEACVNSLSITKHR